MSSVIAPSTQWPTEPDRRFGLVEAPEPDDPWALSLWLLDAGDDPVCVYGWAIPRRSVHAKQWTKAELRGRLSLHRLTCSTEAHGVWAILRRLSAGTSLAEAARDAGCPLPEDIQFGSLRLQRGDALGESHVPTPWTYHPKNSAHDNPTYVKARASPNPDAPAVGTSLIARDKPAIAALLEESRGGVEPILEALESETGFAFTKHDAERLGDIEVFLFPAARTDEGPRAQVSFDPHPVAEIELPEGTPIVVRCAQHGDGLILADETQVLLAGPPPTRVQFAPTPDGPHATSLQIWAGEQRALWFSDTRFNVRRISLTSQLLGPTLLLQSDWLTEWANNRQHKASAAKMAAIVRPTIQSLTSNGEEDAAFVGVSREARLWASTIHPRKSGARFFPAQHRLQFATWVREELGEKSDVGAVALFDPYIGPWGLELLARVESARCQFDVVTTLRRKHPSIGDVGIRDSEDLVRTSLLNSLAGLRIALQGLHLRVSAIGGERAFHDRVLLAYDERQTILRGYQLSNSLDGATKQYSLLVTPIPDDILDAVADDYARMLYENKAETTILYDFATRRAGPPLARVAPSATRSVANAVEALVTAPAEDLLAQWCDVVASIVAAEPRPDAHLVFGSIVGRCSGRLVSTLEQWLTGRALTTNLPIGVNDVPPSRDALEILSSYGEDFNSASRYAPRYAEHYHRYAGVPWTIDYALQLLVHYAPEAFVRTVDGLVDLLASSDAPSPPRHVVGAVLVTATTHVAAPLVLAETDALRVACLGARTPFVRALAAAAVGETLLAPCLGLRIPAVRALDLIETLAHQERLIIVSDWIGGVRSDAAERGGKEDDEARRIEECLTARIVSWWCVDTDASTILELVRRCEGPFPGRWAADTTKLLSRLVAAGALSHRAVARVWLELLAERICPAGDRAPSFNTLSDVSLTETAARVAATHADPKDIELLERAARRAHRQAMKPFARADYAAFRAGADRLLWLEAFARLMLDSVVTGSGIARLAEGIVELARDLPGRALDDLWAYKTPSALGDFIANVRARQTPGGCTSDVEVATTFVTSLVFSSHAEYLFPKCLHDWGLLGKTGVD